MKYHGYSPHQVLQVTVKCFWIHKGSYLSENKQDITPDGCVELIFNFGSPYLLLSTCPCCIQQSDASDPRRNDRRRSRLARPLAEVTAFVEKLPQSVRVAQRIRQSDVSVRSNEIECCAAEAGSPHWRLPRKLMEWKLKFGTRFSQADSRLSIDMNLPRQRSERGEVVLSRPCLDPREAIAASNGVGRALTQRAVAIVDADLRQG